MAGVGWGVENSHFIVWMKDAPLPVFRKAYARFVQQPLKLPFYLKVTNNTYDVKSFGGERRISLSLWAKQFLFFRPTAPLVNATLIRAALVSL